jgi:hypothetical protein
MYQNWKKYTQRQQNIRNGNALKIAVKYMYIPNGCEIYQKIHSKACKNVPKCIGIIGMQKYHLATQVQTFFQTFSLDQ